LIDGMCVVALAPPMIIIRGWTFHPLAENWILSINGLYLLIFASSVSGENLSLQYVNSMDCMVRLGSMSVAWSFWYGNPLTQRMSGLNLELQWHLCVPHVQGSSQLVAQFQCVFANLWAFQGCPSFKHSFQYTNLILKFMRSGFIQLPSSTPLCGNGRWRHHWGWILHVRVGW
jgi:hypothetical protein